MEKNSMFEAKIQMLFSLIGNGYLKDKRLFKAFLGENIEDFIPEEFIYHAGFFNDRPSLFYHQNIDNYRTISAPHMISIMLQGLLLTDPKEDLLILGAKSGFIAALAHKLAPDGRITILEANSEIAKITLDNLKKLNYLDGIEVIVRNPLDGVIEQSPWKKILVTGAISQEKIYPLLEQLDPNEGVLFAPIGGDMIQTYTQILRINDDYFGKKQLNVQFSPLMTKIEIDELELITDFDDLSEDVADDSNSVNQNKINIKYTSSILDEIDLKPYSQQDPTKLYIKPDDIAMVFLGYINDMVNDLKKEKDSVSFTNGIENIDTLIEILYRFKEKISINYKKIRNSFNQIKAFGIMRADIALSDEEKPSSKTLDKKAEIIKKQLDELNKFQGLINSEVKKAKFD